MVVDIVEREEEEMKVTLAVWLPCTVSTSWSAHITSWTSWSWWWPLCRGRRRRG